MHRGCVHDQAMYNYMHMMYMCMYISESIPVNKISVFHECCRIATTASAWLQAGARTAPRGRGAGTSSPPAAHRRAAPAPSRPLTASTCSRASLSSAMATATRTACSTPTFTLHPGNQLVSIGHMDVSVTIGRGVIIVRDWVNLSGAEGVRVRLVLSMQLNLDSCN